MNVDRFSSDSSLGYFRNLTASVFTCLVVVLGQIELTGVALQFSFKDGFKGFLPLTIVNEIESEYPCIQGDIFSFRRGSPLSFARR